MTPVLAIDGPSGAGKSTVARGVAAALSVEVLDTGAMYRAVTFAVHQARVDPSDADACAALARRVQIDQQGTATRLDGRDVSAEIRSPAVTSAVSIVAAHPAVRAVLVEHQRRWAVTHGAGVVEGRDVGTVVFPDAVFKVFLTASDTERARRRRDEASPDGTVSVDTVRAELDRRDRLDTTRSASPLVPAADAVLIDTTDRSVGDIVEEIVAHYRARRGAPR